MNDIELLRVEDVMRIFHASRITVYRWLALARQGKHGLPLPIGGRKQKLLWNRDAIEEYCRSTPEQQQAEKERQQRQEATAATVALLERYDIPYTLPSEQNCKIAENSTEENQDRGKIAGPGYRKVNPPQKRTK
jgi:transposase